MRTTSGVAFVHLDPSRTVAVSVLALLPPPSQLGNFDSYFAQVLIPGIDGFGDELFPTPEEPPTWATTITFPTAAVLTPQSRVEVGPLNTETGISGPVVLEGQLSQCRR